MLSNPTVEWYDSSHMELDRHSHNRLNRFSLRFFPRDTLFDRLGRAICRADCLPRKELFETWEVVRRLRKKFRDRPVVELAAGHGLLSMLLVLLENGIPDAVCYDIRKPKAHDKLMAELVLEWPRLSGRVTYTEMSLEDVEPTPESVVVSVHACGELTDRVLDRALAARAAVAVLPCCHSFENCDDAGLSGWMDGFLAIDAARAARLHGAGYRVVTTTIPEDITPRNRLLMGWPA
ncbi:MAG: methyltransferase [Planctomycetota bacterium]